MTTDLGARWTARQLAMLRAMGIEFGARDGADDPAPAAGPHPETASRPAPSTAAAPRSGLAPSTGSPPAPSSAASSPAGASSGAPSPIAPSPAGAPPAAAAGDRIERYIDDLAHATTDARARAAAPPAAATAAHWLVVSEPLPPGSPPARLLAAMLRAVGLLANDADPRDRRAALAMIEPGADLASDRARLMDAVLRAAPRCILVLGRAPARALLSTELPLAELRGKVHRIGETPVVVSYAVPYLLRQPADKARAWEDLCLATRLSEAPP